MRILLIRFSSLGDILLQTSFASWLKLRYPGAQLSFLTLEGNEALLAGHPHIDEILIHRKRSGARDALELFRLCRKELLPKNFDLIIDLHGTTRSFLVRCFLPEAPALAMDKRRMERFLLVNAKIDLLKGELGLHERNLSDWAWVFNRSYLREALLSFLSKDFPANESLITSSITGKAAKNPKLVALAPGASFAPKRWPVERFFQLAQLLMERTELECVVLGGPEDDFCGVFDLLAQKWPERLRNLQGKLSLQDSMLEASKAALLVGNDSLMNHVAESNSVPVFSIFGPTSESFGFAPRLPRSRSYSVGKLWCRPCSTTGKSPCYRKEQYCMTRTDAERVFQDVKSFFKDGANVV